MRMPPRIAGRTSDAGYRFDFKLVAPEKGVEDADDSPGARAARWDDSFRFRYGRTLPPDVSGRANSQGNLSGGSVALATERGVVGMGSHESYRGIDGPVSE